MTDRADLAQAPSAANSGWREAWRTLAAALLAAVILIVAALAWRAVTGGPLTRLLGGVDRQELAAATALPKGALLLVDDPDGCPPGWTDLGAAEAKRFAGRAPIVVGAVASKRYDLRDTGGAETVSLTLSQMPRHVHNLLTDEVTIRQAPVSGDAVTGSTETVRVLAPRRASALETCRSCTSWATQTTLQLDAASPPAPIYTMPPYVALYFCRRG